MWSRLPLLMVVPSALDHVTLGSGRPETQQLKRMVWPTTQRFGRSRALNWGDVVINSLRRRSDAIDVLVCTDSRSSTRDARSKLELAEISDSQSAPAIHQHWPFRVHCELQLPSFVNASYLILAMCYIHCYLTATQQDITWDNDVTTQSYHERQEAV